MPAIVSAVNSSRCVALDASIQRLAQHDGQMQHAAETAETAVIDVHISNSTFNCGLYTSRNGSLFGESEAIKRYGLEQSIYSLNKLSFVAHE